MSTVNLFLLDINITDNTSGVDRYLGLLQKGLSRYPSIRVCRISFKFDPDLMFYTEKNRDDYREVIIPLPQHPDKIIAEEFWTQRYNRLVCQMIKHLFTGKKNCILHLHTLNLIELALLIKEHIPICRVITHLHCIPWKSLYNTDNLRFNELYEQMYIVKNCAIYDKFKTNNSEIKSYTESDRIICVTECAKTFLEKFPIQSSDKKTMVIANGIHDIYCSDIATHAYTDNFRLLYVGTLTASKGLRFILEAMQELHNQGYSISLAVAGWGNKNRIEQMKKNHPDLALHFTGRISFDELKSYYSTCHAGVIASLQEQCSYVAIEMAMFGLPIITTAVDGLDEMFIDEVNALKVPVHFSKVFGLSVDVDFLIQQIKRLIENEQLRERLQQNVRQLYLEKYALSLMLERTIAVYRELMEEII